MTTDVRTDASLDKTSTNINDSNADDIADDTSMENSKTEIIADDINVDNSSPDIVPDAINIDEDNIDTASDDADTDSEIVSEDLSIDEVSIEAIDIGTTLKEKRLELGYDERHVATELKISIDQVQALESNEFTHFRSVTFARGFLKSYCRLLGIEHSEVLNSFDDGQKEAESTIKPVDKVHRQTHLGDPIVIFISVVIVAVLVFLVFWWPTSTESITNLVSNDQENLSVETAAEAEKAKASELVASTSSESNENESDPETTVLDSTPASPSNIETSKSENAEIDQPVAVVQTAEINSDVVTGLSAETVAILKKSGVSPDEVVKATKAVPAPEAPSAESKTATYLDDIEIVFSEDCWAEIRDASGTILFSGVKSSGTTLELTGNAPYRVVLGYARGVSSLKYKGEQFDFSPFTRKDLARFELK